MLVISHHYERRFRVLGWKQTNAARKQTKTTNKWQKSVDSDRGNYLGQYFKKPKGL